MMARQTVIIHPVAPGPVAKLASRKARNFAPPVFAEVSASASLAKLTMCAPICTTVPKTIDQAVALWKVMFLSKGMIWLRGVRRRREMKLRQMGRRMKITSTCRTRAAARAIAANGTQSLRRGLCQGERTKGDAKRRAGVSEVILQLVV